MQKLDVGLSLEAVFVHKNDSLYYKLCYNVVSLATLAQWHWVKQESPAIADKPARRESMTKIAQIQRAYNVVVDNTGLYSYV